MDPFMRILSELRGGVTPDRWNQLEQELSLYATTWSAGPGKHLIPRQRIEFEGKVYGVDESNMGILVRPDDSGWMRIVDEDG